MTKIADKYIAKSGRTAQYDLSATYDDAAILFRFLVWAERDGALYSMTTATEALRAACRILDISPMDIRMGMRGGK